MKMKLFRGALLIIAGGLVSCSSSEPKTETFQLQSWRTKDENYTLVLPNVIKHSFKPGPDFVVNRYKLADNTLVGIYAGFHPQWDEEGGSSTRKSSIQGATEMWRISEIVDSVTQEKKVRAETLFESQQEVLWHLWVIGDSEEAVTTAIINIEDASEHRDSEQNAGDRRPSL